MNRDFHRQAQKAHQGSLASDTYIFIIKTNPTCALCCLSYIIMCLVINNEQSLIALLLLKITLNSLSQVVSLSPALWLVCQYNKLFLWFKMILHVSYNEGETVYGQCSWNEDLCWSKAQREDQGLCQCSVTPMAKSCSICPYSLITRSARKLLCCWLPWTVALIYAILQPLNTTSA